MSLSQFVSRLAPKPTLHILTFASFCFPCVFLMLFAIFAPGYYQWDAAASTTQTILGNILFALLLVINDACVLLSLFSSLKAGYFAFRSKRVTGQQLKNIALGIYPIIVILFLCSWNFSTFLHYLAAPIHILFRV